MLVLLTALGAWLGFANPLLHVPAAVLAVPLGLTWIAVRAVTGRRAFWIAWGAALLGALGCLYWVAWPVERYGGLPWALALPCPVLVGGVLALYWAFFAWAMHHAARRLSPGWLMCFAGVLWTCLEHLGSHLLTGFPWLTLGSGLSAWPWAVQPAALVGGYGLAGLVAALGTGLVLVNTGRTARWACLALLLFFGLFGPLRIWLAPPAEGSAEVLMVQGAVDQDEKWTPDYQEATVTRYMALTDEALDRAPADLALWPETAMPFYFQDASPLSGMVTQLARRRGVWLVTGAPAYTAQGGGYALYNRAFLVSPVGEIAQGYDKMHLVPFGEYVPLGDILPIEKLAHGVGDFLPGRDPAPLAAGRVRAGMLICYEAIFPDLAQERVAAGANLLASISNDAWFGHTSAPQQHLSHAALRCVEQGRAMARCTNNGITAFIDPLGRIRATAPRDAATVLAGTVTLSTLKTVYHRCYDVVLWGQYILAAAFGLRLLLTRRRDARRLS